ncbi:MAG: putative rane protein [Patescibacteria group bacterium]|nr:putative rane protein [Patescibacteria group bacterium]
MIRNFLLNALAVGLTFYILPVDVVGSTLGQKTLSVVIIALILAGLNLLVKPILYFISIPINIITLGLFSLVINAAIIKLADMISASFTITGWWTYILFALVLSIMNMALSMFEDKED